MWEQIVEFFRGSPRRLEVAQTIIRHGFRLSSLLSGHKTVSRLVFPAMKLQDYTTVTGLIPQLECLSLEEAVKFAVEWTPHGWFPEAGNTVWFDEQLYLEQPGYGTSYVVGKVHLEKLIADRAQKLGEKFRLKQFMDEFHAAGMIPLSLIRWEMTGLDDEIKKLWE